MSRNQVSPGSADISQPQKRMPSGATESNNLALLGLREHGEKSRRKHIVTTAIEHKAVLEGIGALVTRRRGYERPPLTPLAFGGGQERGLRPGTLPVALIVALGKPSG